MTGVQTCALPICLKPGRSKRSHHTGLTVSLPSPTKSHGTPGPRPDLGGGGPRISHLHPDLIAIRQAESGLSKKGDLNSAWSFCSALTVPEFEAVRSNIQADPDYVGELPYIRVQNPQYKIKCLVCAPPESGKGKWYKVSRGTAIGVFNAW